MKWDHGVRNSYRMGAEGKYDLKLLNFDNLPLLESGACSSNQMLSIASATTSTTSNASMASNVKKSNVLANRKSSSTPSLPEATESNLTTTSVASTEQAASADNLTWKQAVETITENVLTSAKSDIVGGRDDKQSNQTIDSVHVLRELENHHDLSLINHTQPCAGPSSDLATITENLTLSNECVASRSGGPSSSMVRQSSLHGDSSDRLSNIETNNKMNSNNSVISKSLLGSIRNIGGAREALEVFDKMREGVDMLRNNTNNIISAELLQVQPSTAITMKSLSATKPQTAMIGHSDANAIASGSGKFKPIHSLKHNKRQIVAVDEACSFPQLATSASVVTASATPVATPIASTIAVNTKRDGEGTSKNAINEAMASTSTSIPIVVSSMQMDMAGAAAMPILSIASSETSPTVTSFDSSTGESVVVTNSMSISVPNLTASSNNESANQIVPVSPPGFLETFAALTRRRSSNQGANVGASGTSSSSSSSSGNQNYQPNNQSLSAATSNLNSNQPNSSSFFPRGQNSVSSLVKLALSSNFHSGFLSTAQSYPSLTASTTNTSNNILNSCSGIASTIGGQNTSINPALTMSLTSASSDSEQVSFEDFLDSCRAPTLLGELDDEEEMDDDNDDDENEDEYEEVGVSFSLFSFVFVLRKI